MVYNNKYKLAHIQLAVLTRYSKNKIRYDTRTHLIGNSFNDLSLSTTKSLNANKCHINFEMYN